MTDSASSVGPAMVLLGAWHGVNPAMGWLFAVALGFQERRGAAVWRALPPLALGHGLAIARRCLCGCSRGRGGGSGAAQVDSSRRSARIWSVPADPGPPSSLGRYAGGVSRSGRVSTLMASAHGAGLMVIPWMLSSGAAHHGGPEAIGLAAAGLHTGAYLGVTALAALTVYYWLGVSWLRTLWANLDLVWGVALIATAVATPFL
jgi:hypothetical protein